MRMKNYLYIIAAALALVACNKEPGNGTYGDDGDIRFAAVRYLNSTKADPEPDPSLGTDVHFGVSADLNYDSGSYAYFKNEEVACTDNVWKGVNALKWPKLASCSLDFLAYAPYSSTPWCELDADGKLVSKGTDGNITVFTTDPEDDNYDLLYSDWTRGATKEGGAVPMRFHHALAAVTIGLNIVRSNDAVILDANGRYTYEEWDKDVNPTEWANTPVSYIVPIGSHPNDVKGIVLPRGTVLSGPVVVFDPTDDTKTITLPSGTTLDQDYIQYQKFGYKLKNSIQNIWIASLIECRMENIATTGSLEMAPDADGKWTLPANHVWTVPSTGEAGLAAHSGSFVFFEEKDIEIPPHMRSTVHTFPMELHIIPQDLKWSPLTPTNNQVMHIKMHVRQFNYKDQSANDVADVNGSGVPTGDARTLDYRDIYKYETNDDGSFKGYVPQDAELAPGVSYKSMVWRDGLTPTYEYDVEKDIILYDSNNFVTDPPQYWKMNTRTVYITRINFADHQIEFAPEVQPFAENEVVGGGINNW